MSIITMRDPIYSAICKKIDEKPFTRIKMKDAERSVVENGR